MVGRLQERTGHGSTPWPGRSSWGAMCQAIWACLRECNLLERGGALLAHHLVQGQQRVKHALHIGLAKVEPAAQSGSAGALLPGTRSAARRQHGAPASFSRFIEQLAPPPPHGRSRGQELAHLDASSRASCHISCHRMAMRISSWLTSWACSTAPPDYAQTGPRGCPRPHCPPRPLPTECPSHRHGQPWTAACSGRPGRGSGHSQRTCSTSVGECWRTLSTTLMAAARRAGDWLLQATSRGYISA